DLARWSANQSMVALEEVRANSAQPELATAIHDVIMDRRPTKGAPRIHIWPRVINADGSTSGAGEAAAGGEDAEEPPQQVDVIISVLADPDSFPPPYEADDFEFLTSWGEGGVQLSVRVTVRDGEGKIVGEPVEKKVGILEVDEEPAVLEDPVVTACALAEDAPAEFDVADTADHCDWSADPILEYDRVALFFTPHRDLGGPDREAEPFVWQLMSPAGEAIASQFWADGEVPVQDGVPTPEASEGAPGRFVTFPVLWGPLFRQRANPLITGPGTYSVQTSPAEYYAEESLLGNASGYYEATGDWQTEGAFELGNIQLHFKDFVMEPAADRPLPERWSGAIKPAKVTVAGSRVSMELEAAWRLESDAQDDQAADSAQHRIHSRITLDFPKTIAPGRDSEFSVDTKLERLETGFGANGLPHGFAFELGLMQSTNDSPPDRHLLRGDERPEPFSTGWRSELTLAGGQRIALEGRSSTTPPMAATQEGQITFTGSGAHTFGTPARRLPWHLRDRSTIWVIPVTSHFVSFDCGRVEGCDQDNEASRSVYLTPQSIVGYAVYGSEPGPYTGPLPQGDPIPVAWVDPSPEEEVPQVAEAPGEDLADGGELPSIDVPDDVAADAPGDVPGDEAVERIDDVSNQGVVPPVLGKTRAEAEAALREHGLEPSFRTGSRAPSKAEAGTVYEQVPVAESTVIPGTSVIVTVYDDWTALVPSVTGETEAAARSRLRDDDLEAQARTGDPAPPGVRAGTVYRQIPAVGSEVEPGTTVHITVYGEALATVPRLVAISESAARRALHDAGLEMRTRTGSAARSAGEAETVYEQIPAAGSTVPPGSTVTVTVYGAYVDRRPPPQEPPRRDPLPAEPVRPEPAEPEGPSLGGRWTTPGGETVQFVRRRDGTLSAAYARGNNGRMIVVDFDGRFLNLIWAKDNYVNSPRPYCDRNMDGVSYWGEMRLEWDPSKNWFHGRYNYCGDPARGQGGGVWYLRRAGP
ncbi:MAG: PASTA domain-containing protein, partial [Gemmatimonadota bacterium]